MGGLKVLAERHPIISLDSFYGREHTVPYSERMQKNWSVLVKIFSTLIRPPSFYSSGIKRNWEQVFPEGNIVIKPREQTDLDRIPARFASSSRGTLGHPINTCAIQARSMLLLADNPRVLERVDMGDKTIETFQAMTELMLEDINLVTASE